jgi:hypothetical protein
MGFLSFLSPIFGLFHKDKKPKGPTQLETQQQNLFSQLQGYLGQANDRSNTAFNAGQADITKGRSTAETSLNYWLSKLGMNREDALSYIDAGDITKGYDAQEQQNYNQDVRGGRRAATLANLPFARASDLNKILSQVLTTGKDNAAQMISGIAQQFSGLGLNEEQLGIGAGSDYASLLNNLYGSTIQQQQFKDQMHQQLLQSIFGAIGSAIGAAAAFCLTPDALILTPSGYRLIGELKEGDEIYSINSSNRKVIRPISRIRKSKAEQIYRVITDSNKEIKGTSSHLIRTLTGESEIKDLIMGDRIPIFDRKSFKNEKIKRITPMLKKSPVVILKIEDDEMNYAFVSNGIISIDDYLLK